MKFYGIGGNARPDGTPAWFRSFYHKNQTLRGYPLDPVALGRAVRRAAAALGLEVYGGDAIATAGRTHRAARPQRVAELRALPRGGGRAHRRAPRAPLRRRGDPVMSERREVGPRSREIVAREQKHIAPGSQSFSLYSGLAMARGQGCTLIDEDGNEYIDFIAGIGVGLGRPLPSPLRGGAQAPGRAADVRQLHHRDPRPVPRAARLDHAGRAHADPALLGRRRGRRGGAAAGPGQDRQARDRRLLGRLPRQDRRRARPARQRLQAPPGSVPARPALHALRRLLSLPAAPQVSRLRHRLRRLRARRHPQPDGGRDRRDHRGADPGHGRQHRAAARLPARHPGDRQGARGAAPGRRDDHRVRPHRA